MDELRSALVDVEIQISLFNVVDTFHKLNFFFLGLRNQHLISAPKVSLNIPNSNNKEPNKNDNGRDLEYDNEEGTDNSSNIIPQNIGVKWEKIIYIFLVSCT